jgi:hypothetical protein
MHDLLRSRLTNTRPEHARSCRDPRGQADDGTFDRRAACQTAAVFNERFEVAGQLRRVIAWEMEAQAGVQRAVEEMPPLMADTLLGYFDISLKPGADVSDLD